jgi:DNA-directed RNA polymerase subunit K/omega
MATQRTSFSKMQRARDKQAKAAAKRDRRLEKGTEPVEPEELPAMEGVADDISTEELLALVERAHQEFDAGIIDFDTFEEKKAGLLSRLTVE